MSDLEKEQLKATIEGLSPSEKEELKSSSISVYSEASTLQVSPDEHFTPGKALSINARGIGIIRLPTPSSELEISVTNPANGDLAYLSLRPQRSSGNCILVAPEKGELLATEYKFGPGRDPKLVVLPGLLSKKDGIKAEAEITTTSKWTSRSQAFVMPGAAGPGSEFEWLYVTEKTGAEGKKETRLVLREKRKAADGRKRTVAVLVRNDETRTPGSAKCTAGNGGMLVLDENSDALLDEPVIVASCLLMLKKEMDRRRAMQFMMLGAMLSGGGS